MDLGEAAPSKDLVKDENGDVLADSQILNRWNSYFLQLLNIHIISDVRQTEIPTAEPPVPGPSCLEADIAIAQLKTINLQVEIKCWQN
jgi:hypothetical protein